MFFLTTSGSFALRSACNDKRDSVPSPELRETFLTVAGTALIFAALESFLTLAFSSKGVVVIFPFIFSSLKDTSIAFSASKGRNTLRSLLLYFLALASTKESDPSPSQA
jgi:hypothetical protein